MGEPVVTSNAMSGFITALTGEGGITASTFWGVMSDLVPYLVVILPVALGFYFVRKLIKGSAKAKVRI